MSVDKYIDDVLVLEGNGKFTNDPKDSGGATRFGITETVARANGYIGDMKELPREVAFSIYKKRYWEATGINLINDVYPLLAERVLAFGILAGPKTSIQFLQRCLNVLNRNGKDYPDISVDGTVGPKSSIPALQAFINKRGEEGKLVLIGMVVSLQSTYLIELAERRPKDEEYEYGWQLNRAIGTIVGKPCV